MNEYGQYACVRCGATEEGGYDLYSSGGEIYCDTCIVDLHAEEER